MFLFINLHKKLENRKYIRDVVKRVRIKWCLNYKTQDEFGTTAKYAKYTIYLTENRKMGYNLGMNIFSKILRCYSLIKKRKKMLKRRELKIKILHHNSLTYKLT